MPTESLLTRTLVELADTLVEDFDVVDLLTLLATRCVDVLDVSAAGIMLVDPEGTLRVMASSSDAMRTLELLELQAEQGPCLDCVRTGEPVLDGDLAAAVAADRWPHFAAEALASGFVAAQAIPMRLRGHVLGALNLFGSAPEGMRAGDLAAARALADIATIAILQHRAAREAQLVNDQLTLALHSRVAIEQAKGVMAERLGVDVEEAFGQLRAYARDADLRLADVAADVIDGKLGVAPTTTEHHWVGYDPDQSRGFVARCSCGWTSRPVPTAGMAAGAVDEHRADPPRIVLVAGR